MYLHSDITGKIIKCAINAHNKLGCGFQEIIYQRAMKIEMEKEKLEFVSECEMDIYYDGEVIGSRRADFFIEDKVMVELKAITEIEEINKNQIINYLEIYKIDVGLLINFGNKRLEFKRFINEKNNQRHQRISA